MDPASAIIMAVLNAGTAVLDTVNAGRAAKYGRLPDWLSPRDFQKRDYTIELLIGGILLVLV
ncbi:MAG: hypothetical protein AAF242_18315, partial [Bacteroidota bacterium]